MAGMGTTFKTTGPQFKPLVLFLKLWVLWCKPGFQTNCVSGWRCQRLCLASSVQVLVLKLNEGPMEAEVGYNTRQTDTVSNLYSTSYSFNFVNKSLKLVYKNCRIYSTYHGQQILQLLSVLCFL